MGLDSPAPAVAFEPGLEPPTEPSPCPPLESPARPSASGRAGSDSGSGVSLGSEARPGCRLGSERGPCCCVHVAHLSRGSRPAGGGSRRRRRTHHAGRLGPGGGAGQLARRRPRARTAGLDRHRRAAPAASELDGHRRAAPAAVILGRHRRGTPAIQLGRHRRSARELGRRGGTGRGPVARELDRGRTAVRRPVPRSVERALTSGTAARADARGAGRQRQPGSMGCATRAGRVGAESAPG